MRAELLPLRLPWSSFMQAKSQKSQMGGEAGSSGCTAERGLQAAVASCCPGLTLSTLTVVRLGDTVSSHCPEVLCRSQPGRCRSFTVVLRPGQWEGHTEEHGQSPSQMSFFKLIQGLERWLSGRSACCAHRMTRVQTCCSTVKTKWRLSLTPGLSQGGDRRVCGGVLTESESSEVSKRPCHKK